MEAKKINWPNEVYKTLWAYKTSVRESINTTLFSLIYGTYAVIPKEFVIFTVKTQAIDKVDQEKIPKE